VNLRGFFSRKDPTYAIIKTGGHSIASRKATVDVDLLMSTREDRNVGQY
jgi:hypothetical protein